MKPSLPNVKYEYLDSKVYNGLIEIKYKSITDDKSIIRNVTISVQNILIESLESQETPPKKWFYLAYKLGKNERSFLLSSEQYYSIFVKLKERQD